MRCKCEVTRNRQRDKNEGVGAVFDTAVASDLPAEFKKDTAHLNFMSLQGVQAKSLTVQLL